MPDTLPNISDLTEIAMTFRQAILRIPADQRLGGLINFPRAACGDTTWLLGAYLQDQGMGGFSHMVGERGYVADGTKQYHAWLQHGNLVIDITADQFPEVSRAVIVERESLWHQQFSIFSNLSQDFRDNRIDGGVDEHLFSMYQAILRAIELP